MAWYKILRERAAICREPEETVVTKNLGQGGFEGRAGTIWSSYMQADIALRSKTEGRLGEQCLVCVCGGEGLIYPRLSLNLLCSRGWL